MEITQGTHLGWCAWASRLFKEFITLKLFPPSLMLRPLRLLMLYALENSLDLEICDVDNAFVQAELPENEVIYMEAPPGMNVPAGYALRLRKALHGLKDNPHRFNKHLDVRLRDHDFIPCKADPCLHQLRLITVKSANWLRKAIKEKIH